MVAQKIELDLKPEHFKKYEAIWKELESLPHEVKINIIEFLFAYHKCAH